MTVRLVGVEAQELGEDDEVEGDAEEAEAGDEEARDGARLEAEVEALGQRRGGRLGDADVGADRDVHADEAGGAREHRADEEADGGVDAEQPEGEDRRSPRRRCRWWCTGGAR